MLATDLQNSLHILQPCCHCLGLYCSNQSTFVHSASVASHSAIAGAAAKVLLACDSRPSSPALLAAAAAGVQALGGIAIDCGQLTTPQLHWQLRRLNQGLPWAMEDYFSTLAEAYQQLVKGTEPLGQVSSQTLPCVCLQGASNC